ncbi:MAG: hypothetical protein J6X88_00030 [Bacteroidales bacterium]|nr:hypothetical protein [Bacteroidales bacterium]
MIDNELLSLIYQLLTCNGYALPYGTDSREVVKVGVQFDRESMTVGEYIVEKA